MPRLLSVNVSLPKTIDYQGKEVTTGIFKEPVSGPVRVCTLNLEGDGQADLNAHGGAFKAVYVYSYNNYSYWADRLQRDFSPGQFGENFTVEGLSDQTVCVGDQFSVGSALFEVTQPRVPCYKLAIKMDHEGFYNEIIQSGRLGFYLRVLKEGTVEANTPITLVTKGRHRITIDELNRLMYFDKENGQRMEEALTLEALSPGWKSTFQQRLKQPRQNLSEYYPLTVVDKIPESDTITSFYLASEKGKALVSFRPGQHLPVKLDIPGQYQTIYRTYTLSDAPGTDYYRLTIKRERAPKNAPHLYPGVSSNYFHDQVAVGHTIMARPPAGNFYLRTDSDRPVVLLSAGVGVTPMISIVNALIRRNSTRTIWFFHGTRNKREHALGRHIRQLAQQYSYLHPHIRYSQPDSEDQLGADYEAPGRITVDTVKRVLPNRTGDFYLCGPGAFMDHLREGLAAWGVPAEHIYYESFGSASTGQKVKKTQHPYQVQFSQSQVNTRWTSDCDSLLELAESEGLAPPFSCRSGICQTCISRLVQGEVTYLTEPTDMPPAGQVLLCCSQPATDVIISV